MIKKAVQRGLNSFAYATSINVVIFAVMMLISKEADYLPLLPGYLAHFRSPVEAVLVEVVLIGMTSAVFCAGSFIMQMERISLLVQSIIYFIITAAVWLFVGCYCWEIHKYPAAMFSVTVSYSVSYFISWMIQYRICRRNVDEINERLSQIKAESQKG